MVVRHRKNSLRLSANMPAQTNGNRWPTFGDQLPVFFAVPAFVSARGQPKWSVRLTRPKPSCSRSGGAAPTSAVMRIGRPQVTAVGALQVD